MLGVIKNQEIVTSVDDLVQEFKGFARTTFFFSTSESRLGKGTPNLADIPTMLSPSTPFSQFLILT